MRCARRISLAVAICISSAGFAVGARPEIEPPDAGRVREIAAMLPDRPTGLGRPITDRAAWGSPGIRENMGDVVATAERLMAEPVPEASDDLFLEFSKTGNRTRYQEVMAKRRARLDAFVLAECVENKGRFIQPFVDTLRTISKEATWLYPAHDPSLRNFKGETIDIDLGSVAVAWTLATADWVLGDKLPGEARTLSRQQLELRIFKPFKDMVEARRPANWWLTGKNNWNSVCLAGVTGSALALIESRDERAYYVVAAEALSKHFVSGIPADGYCTEGVGYWNYGFGNYILLAETVLQATGGKLDLLTGEHVKRIALYGLHIAIAPGVCPAFADCSVDARPSAFLVDYIARRWGRPVPPGLSEPRPWSSMPLYWVMACAFPNSVSDRPKPQQGALADRTWFDEGGVLIGRPTSRKECRLAAAMKGGNNAEQHNHNDVGSYLVVVDGRAVLIDPGSEVYTRRTFSERRYESKVLNSFGHPVPIVAGKLQRPGPDARGRVLEMQFADSAETLVLDIKSAYDVPEIEKLERTFVYSREEEGSLTVTDEVVFSQPRTFGTALVTFGTWRPELPGGLTIEDGGGAVNVEIHCDGGEIAVQAEEIHEDLLAKRTPTRIGLNFKEPIKSGRISVVITPTREK